MVTTAGCPDGSRNRTVPVRALLLGLTSTTCVVHPPPSAKWAAVTGPCAGGASRSSIGQAVMRKSERSLINPRTATTAMGTEAVNEKVPLNEDGPLNGDSLRNAAICLFAGIVTVP